MSELDSKYTILVRWFKGDLDGPVLLNDLRSDGYRPFSCPHYAPAPWVWVRLYDHTYAKGVMAIKISDCLNNHAVTVKEFYRIREIYESGEDILLSNEVKTIYDKYKGLDLLVMDGSKD